MRLAKVRRFAGSEEGSATVEACLWIPFFCAFLVLVLDATHIFARKADAQRIVQDGTRQFVASAFDSTTDMETWIETGIRTFAPTAEAHTSLDPATGMLTTWVTYSAGDTDLSGATGLLGGTTIRVQSVQLTEQ